MLCGTETTGGRVGGDREEDAKGLFGDKEDRIGTGASGTSHVRYQTIAKVAISVDGGRGWRCQSGDLKEDQSFMDVLTLVGARGEDAEDRVRWRELRHSGDPRQKQLKVKEFPAVQTLAMSQTI